MKVSCFIFYLDWDHIFGYKIWSSQYGKASANKPGGISDTINTRMLT